MSGRLSPVDKHKSKPLASAAANHCRTHCGTIANLPDPDTEWTSQDLDEWEGYTRPDHGTLLTLAESGLIESKGKTSGSNPIRIFSVSSKAYARAHEYLEHLDMLPCCNEGTGFTNVGSDDGRHPYECNVCGARHPREVIEEVIC